MISQAMRKYHPATHDRIELYTSLGTHAGSDSLRKRSQPLAPKASSASRESSGMVRMDSNTPSARFQAWLVKIRNTAAISTPSRLPCASATKKYTAAGKNPTTGTDCAMSIAGIITRSHIRPRAANMP